MRLRHTWSLLYLIFLSPVSVAQVINTATMDTVWVSGKLTLAQVKTQMGHSGYRLQAALVEPYSNKP